MKLEEYRRKRQQDPEYIAAKKALRWHFFIEDTKLAFHMWWRSYFGAGYEFGRAFFGWLRWCKHGLPRRRACQACELIAWTYGPHGAVVCSEDCAASFEDSIDF